MVGIDSSLNWVLVHWYLFAILGLTMVLYQWYSELQRFKRQFTRWCQDRQELKIPQEQAVNPSMVFKKLLKMHPFSDKTKLIGTIQTYSEEPIKGNPTGKNILIRVTTKTPLPVFKVGFGKPKNYAFMKSDVFMDEKKGSIKVPANFFWERNSDGTFMLISPHIEDIQNWVDDKLYKDIHETAIDGYATQMSSYSSVKPTWGHDERMMDKEGESRMGALENIPFVGNKKKKPEKSEE